MTDLRIARTLFVVWLILLALDAGAASDQASGSVTAIVHVAVIPMDHERILDDSTVVVVDGRIRRIGATSAVEIPEDAAVIDGQGKYLMPGLADMHAHTWDEEDFPLLLANGVTTIRNMFGGATHLRWKERIAAGELRISPTIYTAGPIIDGNPPIWPGAIVENLDQARRTVAEQQDAGYDFLKVYSRLSLEAYEAVMRESHKRGLSVAGHVPDAVGLGAALRSGMASIEHLSGYEMLARQEVRPGEEASWARLDESRFSSIAQETARSRTWNCPTLVLFQHRVAPGEPEHLSKLLARPEMRYVSPQVVRSWQPENNYLKNATPARAASSRERGDVMRKKLVKALNDAGARLLLGTDYGNPFVVPGFSLQLELRNFVDAGLTPFQAIRAGTSDAAEFMNAAGEWGTVMVGSRADLILLEENPLKDVSTISRPVGVMVRGAWHSRAVLEGELEKLAERFRNAAE